MLVPTPKLSCVFCQRERRGRTRDLLLGLHREFVSDRPLLAQPQAKNGDDRGLTGTLLLQDPCLLPSEHNCRGQKLQGIAVWTLLYPVQLPGTYECRVHSVQRRITPHGSWLNTSYQTDGGVSVTIAPARHVTPSRRTPPLRTNHPMHSTPGPDKTLRSHHTSTPW